MVANSITYDGASHDLVSVSDVIGGTVKYKTADDAWTETIPTGTEAGSYTVIYKIVSTDTEYDDSLEKSVTVTIAKATASYTGEKQTADIAESMLYTVTANDGGINVGSYGVELTLKDPANSKWSDSEEISNIISVEIFYWSISNIVPTDFYNSVYIIVYSLHKNDTICVICVFILIFAFL